MNHAKSTTLRILGTVFIIYWCLEFWYNAVAANNYSWLLWYSVTGFLLVGIALIVQNTKFTYSLFCALFAVEAAWTLDMLHAISSNQSWFGLAGLLSPTFQVTDFYFTLYHALIPIGLLIAAFSDRETYDYGWVGATLFAFILAVLTYLLVSPASEVNCLYPGLEGCYTVFSFLYGVNALYRIFIGVLGLMVFVFIPSNYILNYLKKSIQI